jgi:hypothetical protein
MAFNLKITGARVTTMEVQSAPSGPTVTLSYRLCVGGPDPSGKNVAPWVDVVFSTGERVIQVPLGTGAVLPSSTTLAAQVKADCKSTYGGTPDAVLVGGQWY